MLGKPKPKEYDHCPIWDLDEASLEHWDNDTLCESFSCKECVATDEELGRPSRECADDLIAKPQR